MKLTLYYFESCPYCQKVLQFITKQGLGDKIKLKDTRLSKDHFQELLAFNHGNKQVPCLLVDSKPMLESDDIISFLRQTFVRS